MGVGIIVIAILMVVGAFLLVTGIVTYLFLPSLLKEWRYIIELYFDMKLKDALFRHLIHLLFFIPILLFFLYIAYTFDVSYLYMFALVVFLGSSFFGFYIFLYFLFSIQQKNLKKVIIALFLGSGIFVSFAPSGYYVFLPIYEFFNKKETITKNQKSEKEIKEKEIIVEKGNIGYTKNIKNPVDIFTAPTITSNMSPGEKERVERFKELENTRSYNYYLNMKRSSEVSQVKMVAYYEDFLVSSSWYEFTYLATSKYFEFLAKHDKYPKRDPKNVPVHKVSCSDYSKSKIGDECYFGVLYPYFHNIIYTPKTEEVKHSVGYYCW
jgi:hypothetical protein